MTTKLNSMLSESASTPTPEHNFVWNDQSGQSAGSQMIYPRAATFTITGWTETGTLAIGSPTVTSMSSTVRPRIGMSVTGTGIPGGTTVSGVSHSAGTITLSANATANGAQTLTFSGDSTDPVFGFGYNAAPGGSELIEGEGSATVQIEGHYHRESDDAALMEMFFDFNVLNATGHARPLNILYDKLNKTTMDCEMNPGPGYSFKVRFEEYTGGSGGVSHEFKEGIYELNPPPLDATVNTKISIGSNSTKSSYILMSAHADDNLAGEETLRIGVDPLASNADRQMAISMRSNGSATKKTGVIGFRADDTAGYDTVLLSVGRSSSYNSAVFNVESTNAPTTIPTVRAAAKASQTAAVILVDGTDSGGTAEVSKWQLFPKGSVSVKPSGGAVTAPTAGSGGPTALPTAANKPGTAIGSCTVTWFPMLDATGALFWIPGWSA